MKGLLLKDFYTLIKQLRIFFIIIVVYSFIPGLSALAFAIVYAAMLPVTALAYDERSKWDELAMMMPYSPREIVGGKYLLGWISIGAVSLLSCAGQIAVAIVKGTSVEPEAFLSILLTACISAILQSVNLPLMYKMGVEKARLVFLLLSMAVVAGGMLFAERITAGLSSEGGLIAAMIALPVLTIGGSLISIRLSAAFYRKKKA